jgi:hypothetical protein
MENGTIGSGFCECGCGQETPVATQNDKKLGAVKGRPRRFMHGHSSRYKSRNQGWPLIVDGVECMAVPLTQGLHAIVDKADYPLVIQWNWQATALSKHSRTRYAIRRLTQRDGFKGTQKRVRMHAVISGVPEDRMPDHINHNGLDNRRCNLRPVTEVQNAANRRVRTDSSCGFKGVIKKGNVWRARAYRDGIRIHLGYFASAEDAARAYDDFVFAIHGEFAALNFPRN